MMTKIEHLMQFFEKGTFRKCLIFWRVYLFCCASLTLEQRSELMEEFSSVRSSAPVTSTQSEFVDDGSMGIETVGEEVIELVVNDDVVSEAVEDMSTPTPAPVATFLSTGFMLEEAFDSHFHLDRTERSLWG